MIRNRQISTPAAAWQIWNFTLGDGYGFADYMLYVDAKAAGVIEVKRQGATLSGVETRSCKCSKGQPP